MRSSTTSTFPSYAQYTTGDLLRAYDAAPAHLRTAVSGLSREELQARPRPGKWSIIEIARHLTDGEVVGAGRIRSAWAEPGTNFIGYNQDRWAVALDYQPTDSPELDATLDLFEALRRTTTVIFQRASENDWLHRWGMHPQHGPVTLRNLLELYADHGERHLGQILTLRALLRRPMDLPVLLPERLY
jgi:uncharacterized damage-inducible protein DinB